MAGEEYARAYAFGNGPLNEVRLLDLIRVASWTEQLQGRWREVSPCDLIEPISK